jgi:hypothetical protein
MRGPLPSESMIALASFHCSSGTPCSASEAIQHDLAAQLVAGPMPALVEDDLRPTRRYQEKPEIVALPLVQRCPQPRSRSATGDTNNG